jgi:hypothetical protein
MNNLCAKNIKLQYFINMEERIVEHFASFDSSIELASFEALSVS